MCDVPAEVRQGRHLQQGQLRLLRCNLIADQAKEYVNIHIIVPWIH